MCRVAMCCVWRERKALRLYDILGVELTHEGELCSFDAFLKKYQLDEPALQQLAQIVRGADTSRLDLTPQSAGLYAISLGLSNTFTDDHENAAPWPGHVRRPVCLVQGLPGRVA